MKRTIPLFLFLVVALVFELAYSPLPIMDWFWVHVGRVLAVLVLGAALRYHRRSRRFSRLLLSAGATAAVAGTCAYLLYPLFASASPPPAGPSDAVANALGPIFFAGVAAMLGLAFGWLPAWLYFRSYNGA